MKIEIRALQKDDDTASFFCGVEELDLFFHKYAKQNQYRHYIGTTYVALLEGVIVGFVSVSVGEIRAEVLHEALRKRLPRYPLPILRLTRLAVDRRFRGHGIGRALLRFVLRLSLEQKSRSGCWGVVVDAKEGSEGFYAAYGFEPIEIESGALDVRPYPVTMVLPVRQIEKSIR